MFENTKLREESNQIQNKINLIDSEIDEMRHKLVQANEEANNLERDNKMVTCEINNSIDKLTQAHHNDVYIKEKELEYLKSSNFDQKNDRNTMRDRMDLEIKLMLESIKVVKHEHVLASDYNVKLMSERAEAQELSDKNKYKNETVVANLRK